MTIPVEIACEVENLAVKEAIDHSDLSTKQQSDKKPIEEASSVSETGKNSGNTNGNTSGNITSGKRAKNKKRREAQQEFTHSWVVGALKGHTGPVLDINFSSNGKFLASCAEDCDLVPEEESELGVDASSGGPSSTSTTSSSPSSSPKIVETSKVRVEAKSSTKDRSDWSSLSRRQRKNRTRAPREQQRRERDDDNDEENPEVLHHHHHHHKNAVVSSPSRHRHHHRLLQHHTKLNSRHFHQESPPRDSARSVSNSVQTTNSKSKPHRSSGESSPPEHSANFKGLTNDITKVTADSSSKNSVDAVNKASESTKNNSNESAMAKSWDDMTDYSGPMISTQREALKYLTDSVVTGYLRGYLLTESELYSLGYPVQCSRTIAVFSKRYHQQHSACRRAIENDHHHHLDANSQKTIAREILSATSWTGVKSRADSGNGSGSSLENSDLEAECSSDSDKSSDVGESSSSSSSSSSSYTEKPRGPYRSSPEPWETVAVPDPDLKEKLCARCQKGFYLNKGWGEFISDEKCLYHWGKLGRGADGPRRYSCCRGHEGSIGCTTAKTHVWTGLYYGHNYLYEGFVRTKPAPKVAYDGNYGVYALDCEMCYTRRGLELVKVTVVQMDGRIIYDTLVEPYGEIIDYNTRYSGITEEILDKATKTLQDVQRELTSFIHAETILIGHGLENDLRALKLIHNTIIDTCITFPHPRGLPYRNSLKNLAKDILNKDIQVGAHDSAEDARTATDLILNRLQYDLQFGGNINKH